MKNVTYTGYIFLIIVLVFSVTNFSAFAYDLCQKEIVSVSAEFSDSDVVVYTVPEGKRLIVTDIHQSGRESIEMTKLHYTPDTDYRSQELHLNSGIPYNPGEQIIVKHNYILGYYTARIFISGYLIQID